jgi:hypothetical protein
MSMISEANVPTENAVSYMKQLCRHWGHKFPVTFDDQQGRIELPQAICTLNASPASLHVRLEVEEGADEARKQQVVAEHLQRFGFREELVFDWHPAGVAA